MRCEPANTIIEKLGGPTEVAKLTGKTPHTVIRWRRPEAVGGTGGAIPRWHINALLESDKAKELGLTLADFYAPGAA